MEAQSHLQLSDDGFLFDHYSGASFTLNRSAVSILEFLIKGLDRDQIIIEMGQLYQVDQDRLERDLDMFLSRLENNRLLRQDGQP